MALNRDAEPRWSLFLDAATGDALNLERECADSYPGVTPLETTECMIRRKSLVRRWASHSIALQRFPASIAESYSHCYSHPTASAREKPGQVGACRLLLPSIRDHRQKLFRRLATSERSFTTTVGTGSAFRASKEIACAMGRSLSCSAVCSTLR